jgi:hypothetical protein
MYHAMTDADVARVCDAVTSVVREAGSLPVAR